MTESYLLDITLKQLLESLETSIECFTLEGPSVGNTSNFNSDTLIWKFRVEIDGRYVQDPNNSPKTIIVNYSKISNKLSAYLFMSDIYNTTNLNRADATASVYFRFYPILYRQYRAFEKLKKTFLRKKAEKDMQEYMRKLNSIFPTAGDDNLLG